MKLSPIRVLLGLAAVPLLAAPLLSGCKEQAPPPAETQPVIEAKPAKITIPKDKLARFEPLPAVFEAESNPISDAKIALGRMLYYDKRLSKNHDISCNSCHDLAKFGVDGKPTSPGHKGELGTRNSPTVYNSAGQGMQFWDGRSPDVEDQAKGPILNPVEMAMPDEKYAMSVINSIPAYVEAFKKAFPDDKSPVSYDNVGKAIGAFERKLVTPARWDKFLGGDESALGEEEKAGFLAFLDAGCRSCHGGPLLGGGDLQVLGAAVPWTGDKDLGRFDVTKKDMDKQRFKTAILRNVSKTGPYFHHGGVATLEAAVKLMGKHQSDEDLTDEQVKSIVAFLQALTGEIDLEYVKEPALPESTAKTPKPDPS